MVDTLFSESCDTIGVGLVAKDTAIRVINASGNEITTEFTDPPQTSQAMVTTEPTIIELAAPATLTRFQNKAARTAGVIAAPYIV